MCRDANDRRDGREFQIQMRIQRLLLAGCCQSTPLFSALVESRDLSVMAADGWRFAMT